jgi:hypothetical protein
VKTLARAADRDELLARVRSLTPDSARRWGRMSVHQMVCHAADAFDMALARKDVTQAAGLLGRTIVKWYALYLPLHWPAGIPTSPEIDQLGTACTRPATFDADRDRLAALVTEMAGLEAAFEWAPHPVFGPLSPGDWLRWGYLHTDHHLRQFGA